jgi:uroporphyrinogen decarboxylase
MPGEMNPRERWGLILIDEFPDRPPVFPLVTSHAAKAYGCDLITYCTNGKVLAEAQISAQRTYGHDGLSVFTDVGIIAQALGSEYYLREFEVPILVNPVIKNLEQIQEIPISRLTSQGRLQVYVEAIELMYYQAGDILPIFAYIPSPFTTSAGLRGIDQFLMDTVMAPEAAHQLLEISLQAAIGFCHECILAGALPILVDPLASGSVISGRTFARFVLPYLQRLIKYLHRLDLDITLHICGDTSMLLDLIHQTGADLFSFDQVNISSVREAMGEKLRLVGNLSPNMLLSSNENDLEEAVEMLIQDGLKNPKGFVLSTGCEVPIKCETWKLQKMINIGKNARYGKEW